MRQPEALEFRALLSATAVDDSISAVGGQAVVVDVLANDSDDSGDELSVQSVGAASHGTTELRPTDVALWNEFVDFGSMYGYASFDAYYSDYYMADASALDYEITYTPDANFSGTDSFSYTVVGSDGQTAAANVTIAVTENTAPEFGQSEYTFDVSMDATDGTVIGSVAASDVDGHTISYSSDDWVFSVADNGDVVLNYAYDLQYAGTGGTYAFAVNASDGIAQTSTYVAINVLAGETEPYADDMYTDDMYADDMYADDMYADDMYADDMYTDDMYTDDMYTDDIYIAPDVEADQSTAPDEAEYPWANQEGVEVDYVNILRNSPVAAQLAPFFQQIQAALLNSQQAGEDAQGNAEQAEQSVPVPMYGSEVDESDDDMHAEPYIGSDEESYAPDAAEDTESDKVGTDLAQDFKFAALTLPVTVESDDLFAVRPTRTESFDTTTLVHLDPMIDATSMGEELDTTGDAEPGAADEDTAAATSETQLSQTYVSPTEFTITQVITNSYTRTEPLLPDESATEEASETDQMYADEMYDGEESPIVDDETASGDSGDDSEESDRGTQTVSRSEQYSVTMINGTQTVTTYTFTDTVSGGVGNIPGMEDDENPEDLTIPDSWQTAAAGPDDDADEADSDAANTDPAEADAEENTEDDVWNEIFNRPLGHDETDPTDTPASGTAGEDDPDGEEVDDEDSEAGSGARFVSTASITVTITETLITLPDGSSGMTTSVSFGTSSSSTFMSAGESSIDESDGTLNSFLPAESDDDADSDDNDDDENLVDEPLSATQPAPEISTDGPDNADDSDDLSVTIDIDSVSSGGNGNSANLTHAFMNYSYSSQSFNNDLSLTTTAAGDMLPSVSPSGSVSYGLAFGSGGLSLTSIVLEDQTSGGSADGGTEQFEYSLYSDISGGGHYNSFSFGVSVAFGEDESSDGEASDLDGVDAVDALPDDDDTGPNEDDDDPQGNHLSFSNGSHSGNENFTAYVFSSSQPSLTSSLVYVSETSSSGSNDFSFTLDSDGLDIDVSNESKWQRNEDGASISTSSMYGDQDTSWLPDGATWFEHRGRTETIFNEHQSSSSAFTFGLDSSGVTVTTTSTANANGAGAMVDESLEHSVLLDDSEEIRKYTTTDSYAFDLESIDGAEPTGSSSTTSAVDYDGYDGPFAVDTSITIVNTYPIAAEGDGAEAAPEEGGTTDDDTPPVSPVPPLAKGNSDDGTTIAYSPDGTGTIGTGDIVRGESHFKFQFSYSISPLTIGGFPLMTNSATAPGEYLVTVDYWGQGISFANPQDAFGGAPAYIVVAVNPTTVDATNGGAPSGSENLRTFLELLTGTPLYQMVNAGRKGEAMYYVQQQQPWLSHWETFKAQNNCATFAHACQQYLNGQLPNPAVSPWPWQSHVIDPLLIDYPLPPK